MDWLVNSAGYGITRVSSDPPSSEEQALLDVLVVAVMRLTHAALPGVWSSGARRILNVSSVAGWLPMGTYSAAKAWVTTFTRRARRRDTGGIHATALCPGSPAPSSTNAQICGSTAPAGCGWTPVRSRGRCA